VLKKILYFFLTFFITLATFSFLQEEVLDSSQKYFPAFKEYIPDSVQNIKSLFQEEPKKEETKVKTNLYAGDNYAYLQSFLQKLSELEIKKKQVVRILHYGDSMLWSDMITSGIKERFQKDFGDGGRGLVPITNQPSRKVLLHKNLTDESQFTWKNLDHRQFVNPQIGFLGEAAISNYPRVLMKHELDGTNTGWKRAELFFRNTQSQNPLIIKASYQTIKDKILQPIAEERITQSNSEFCNRVNVSLDDASLLQLELTAPSQTIFDALNFETEFGVSYSTVSRQGIEVGDLLLIEEKSLACGFTQYKPDLVVFQFGVNESENLARKAYITPESYRKNLEDVVVRFKTLLPDANFLLISPIERISRNEKGIMQTMPEILFIRDTQREVAEKYKIAFFDSFAALGGAGQNDILSENGFMQPDKTHLTRKGGEFFAEVFYSDFFTHYKKFNGVVEETRKLDVEKLKKEKNKEVNFVSKAYFYFFIFVWICSALLTRFPELKIGFLAIVSFYFYATWNVYALGIILISTLIDYFCGLQIYKKQQAGSRGTFYLVLSLTSNLSILFFFKYYDFVISLINGVLVNGNAIQIPLLHFILPVGISFYTFQTLSYTIDIWRKKLIPETRLIRFAEFVAFFPQLVAGPIVRATEFLPGLRNRGEHFRLKHINFSSGIFQILVGVIKKILADRLAFGIVDGVYANPDMYSSIEIMAGIYAYGVQIYFDFSGYSDIAIGSAKILGYHLTLNFNRPYTSYSITDFWRRWHISLGSWFRDYLYIPLGGNRNSVYRNLLFTFILCGIWHGAGIPFFIWGFYHGALLVMERLTGINKKENIFMRAVTLHLVLFGWVIFRSDSWLTFSRVLENVSRLSFHTANLEMWIICFLAIYYFYELFYAKLVGRMQFVWYKSPSIIQGIFAAILILTAYYLHRAEVKPFIYFQF
jgi:D-alanyl-lipoteichoic acid acyltransferase DltB (MBOAT superfamily)/lysophospholipase L1-like esterase